MKKLLAGVLAAVLLLVLVPIADAASYPYGDANLDGKVTAADATIVLRSTVDMVTLSATQKLVCDVTGDGSVTAADASRILRMTVDLDPSAGTCVIGSAADEAVTASGVIEAHELRLRAGAANTYAEIAMLVRGDKVNLYHKVGDWYYVKVTASTTAAHIGLEGYVSALNDYVTLSNTRLTQWGVTTASLSLYKGLGLSTGLTGTTISANTHVGVLRTVGNWAEIRLCGTTIEGYVMKDFIQMLETVDSINLIGGATLANASAIAYTALPLDDPAIPSISTGLTACGKIDADELYLRKFAAADGEIVTTMVRNAEVFVYHKIDSWYFVQVKATGEWGYCASKYVKLTTTRLSAFGEVAASQIYLRVEAKDGAALYCTLPSGTKLGILAQTGDYYLVRIPSCEVEGYVLKEFVTITGTADATIVAPTPTPSATPTATATASASPTASAATNPSTKDGVTAKAKINASGVNIRTGAGVENTLVDTLKKNTVVYVFVKKAASDGSIWYQIQPEGTGTLAWVHGNYLTFTNERIVYWAIVNAADVNFRAGPSTTSTKLKALALNTDLGILGQSADKKWYKVRLVDTDEEGYISVEYVTLTTSTDG